MLSIQPRQPLAAALLQAQYSPRVAAANRLADVRLDIQLRQPLNLRQLLSHDEVVRRPQQALPVALDESGGELRVVIALYPERADRSQYKLSYFSSRRSSAPPAVTGPLG